MTNLHKAIVLFSGGQDSTICLISALERFEAVETIGFDYGQRHRVELTQRQHVREALYAFKPDYAEKLGEDQLIPVPSLGALGETAMTAETEIEIGKSGLPTTFVPGRNLVFLALAGALAWRRGAGTLVGGMCETDFSGYPDCRRNTLDAQEQALALGLDMDLTIDTPLMYVDKAATWQMAYDWGGDALVELVVEHSHTCYKGDRSKRHDWGYGCGECPACELRAAGWKKWLASR
ncbi:MAG: 7-cyano-7-deazaguanine synthase QueC [Pseudomonadota bacterium]